ncbi:MAG: hypothetical protein AAF226_10120 [Verrucomicrobiota bacterium]
MADTEFSLDEVTDEHDDLVRPIVYWQGQLSVFVRSNDVNSAHQFGGALPAEITLPKKASLHTLLNIDTTKCSALRGLKHARLPLIFPFCHDGGHLVYHLNNNVITVDQLSPELPDTNWPYENFPQSLPASGMSSSPAFEVEREDVEELLWQGFYGVPDEHVVIVIPPREDYGVSLWGEIGDAEMVQCVFIFDPVTGKITAENQCS